jgi:CheY-like chemotaxis protein
MSLLILVVDDEPDVEMLFRQQFRRDIRDGRFTMDFAQSANGALNLISDAAGASLILILSDINMPGMSGLELLPKAKAARPDVPVIMLTAYGDPDTRRKAMEGGADALLTNPSISLRFAARSTAVSEGPEPRWLQPVSSSRKAASPAITAPWDAVRIVTLTGTEHKALPFQGSNNCGAGRSHHSRERSDASLG